MATPDDPLDRPDPLDEPGPLSDPEFLALARRVRRTADEELADIEYETDRAQMKRQDLTARSMQAMMEGERWQVNLGNRVIDGMVVHVGQNFTGLQDRSGNLHDVVHAAISLIRVVAEDPRQGRAPTTLRPATFMARLLGLEHRREVELAGFGGAWAVVGTIDSVNSDHLVIDERNGETSIIPIDAIGYLGRVADPTGRVRRLRPPG
ncbi:MAG: hypothetical protein AAGD35_21350 [Actinomycetota bacterium]